MEKSEKSIQRLNKHKIECNKLSDIISRTTKLVQEIKPTTPDIINIAETYRDKIIEIDRELELQSIDFWSDSFELRDAIILHLKEKMGEGLTSVIYVGSKILAMSKAEFIKKSTRKRKNNKINNVALRSNKSNNYIENYNLKENINETLLTYFLNIDSELLRPNDLTKTYLKMKENARTLGIDKEINIEPELIKLIEYKEQISENFETKSKNKLKEIYKELGITQNNEKHKVRQRAL